MMQSLKSLFGAPQPDAEAHARIAKGAIVVDVRTPEEYASGHFRHAANIPLHVLPARASELRKDASIVVYCRSGGRSASAKQLLDRMGFRDVYDAGGLHNL